MPMKPKEMEKLILADGYSRTKKILIKTTSIQQSPVTIPFHNKDLPKGTENNIKRQAGLR